MEEFFLGTISILFMHIYMTKMYINRIIYIWYDSIYTTKESIIRTVINTVLILIGIIVTISYIPYYHPENIVYRAAIVALVLIFVILYYKKEVKDLTKFNKK
jgi:hypothetical protein